MWSKSKNAVEDKTQPTECGVDLERVAYRDKGLWSGGSSGYVGWPDVDYESEDCSDRPSMVDMSTQVNLADFYAEDSAGTSSTVPTAGSGSEETCVDLKGMEKLHKLCYLLRSNVVKLKTSYNVRQRMGFQYTESEHDGLNTGIRALERDLARLLNMLDTMDGHRDEIRSTVKEYVDYEARYRELRRLNKRGRQYRTNMCRRRTGPDGGDPTFRGCALSRLLSKYLCQPCRNMYQWVTAYGRG